MNKTISIFLASSNELKDERIEFGDFVRQIDNIYEKRGTRVILLKWEDFDASYNDCRKQDEYNEKIRACNIFVALFHIKAGEFTIEEFNVAYKEFQSKELPKIYIYCKDLKQGEKELPELSEFKKRLKDEMGHFWCHFSNSDRLQLHFILQLLNLENSNLNALKVEDNGKITLDGIPISDINRMPFVANNKDYQKKLVELQNLPKKIKEAQWLKEQVPDNQYVRDEYQAKVNLFEQLKNDCHQYLVSILETAKRISEMQSQKVDKLMQQAIDAFEESNLERTNAILDIIVEDTEQHFNKLEQDQAFIHRGIKALRLNANTAMADLRKSIGDRIKQVSAIYEKADNWARSSSYDPKEYIALLLDYAEFLYQYVPKYRSKTLSICNRILYINNGIEESEDNQQVNIAECYNIMGKIYSQQVDHALAQECYEMALEVAKKAVDHNQTDIARYIFNIGASCFDLGLYEEALRYYFEAAAIFEQLEKEGAEMHIMLATTYDNIGQVSACNDNCQEALESYSKALAAYQKSNDYRSQFRVAHVYYNIGAAHQVCGNFDQALAAYHQALEIREKELGTFHPETAISYFGIGQLFSEQEKYDEALSYLCKALDIQEQILGNEHFDTERTRNCIQSASEHF